MTPPSIVIATMTLARDDGEAQLLREALHALVEARVPVFVSDGGSGERFTAYLSSLNGLTVRPASGKGLVPQVAAAVGGAVESGAAFVVYTEPDKREFFESGLPRLLEAFADVREAGNAPLLLAARSAGSYATFPPVQRYTEGTINDLCGEAFAAPGDYSYGPFVMPANIARWIRRVPADLGWGWRHFLFAVAHRLGHPLRHLGGDFACPVDQRAENDRERLHRLRQLDQNVSGLQAGLTIPLDS